MIGTNGVNNDFLVGFLNDTNALFGASHIQERSERIETPRHRHQSSSLTRMSE